MAHSFRDIVLFAPNWIGDAAMATPALRAVVRSWPGVRVRVAARAPVCDLLDDFPGVEAFVALPSRGGLAALYRVVHQIRQEGVPDLAIVLPHSFRAALLARMSGARHRVGHRRQGRGFLLTQSVEPLRENDRIKPVYMADEYLTVVQAAGAQPAGGELELHARENDRRAAAQWTEGNGPLVGLAPGAAFGPSKRWPPERFAAVADRLANRHGARTVVITGPGEERIRDAVLAAMQTPAQCSSDAPVTGIAGLKALISRLDLLVGNDSGPRHIALAFGVPVVCVMGPTAPDYSTGAHPHDQVIRVNVSCGPCQQRECAEDFRCMLRVEPDRVADAAGEFLAGNEGAS